MEQKRGGDLTDEPNADGKKHRARQAGSPPPTGDTEREHAHQGADTGDSPSERERRTTLRFLRELNTNERITAFLAASSLMVAVGSLATAVVSCQNASDTSDIKGAVTSLAKLAGEQKRQADAAVRQVDALSRQADAAQGQLDEAKKQTSATLRSASAAVHAAAESARAADAQRQMAETTEKTQRPRVSLGALHVTGFTGGPDASGLVPISVSWAFKNTGGGSFISKQVEWGISVSDVIPDKMPQGITTQGNDYTIVNSLTSAFNNESHPVVALHISTATRDAVLSGAKSVFFYARFDYDDGVSGESRSKCFGEFVFLVNGASLGFRPAGGRAYQCDERRR